MTKEQFITEFRDEIINMDFSDLTFVLSVILPTVNVLDILAGINNEESQI